jgi:YHS domain-containing protein
MRIYGRLWLASFSLPAAAALAAVLASVLASCTSMNVVSEGGDSQLMLRGNDPVAYFTAGSPTPGRQDIKAEHLGSVYRFASEENRRQFITSPDRYAPQFGGFSAQAMVYAIPEVADGRTFKIIDGRLYLFETPRARLYFEMDQERNLAQATRYWESEVRDAPSWHVQAWRRLVVRVPGYKTDFELGKEYERRFNRKP